MALKDRSVGERDDCEVWSVSWVHFFPFTVFLGTHRGAPCRCILMGLAYPSFSLARCSGKVSKAWG